MKLNRLALAAAFAAALSLVAPVPTASAVPTATAPARATGVAAQPELVVDRTLGFGSQNAVACTTQQFCMVVGNNGHAATFRGGALARRLAFPLHGDQLYDFGPVGLSCASATFCAAVGNGLASTFDGRQWSATTPVFRLDTDTGNPPAVSCTGPAFCATVGGLGTWATWNGSAWHTRTDGPDAGPITSGSLFDGVDVSCATTRFCVAVVSVLEDELGGIGRLMSWDGARWREPVGEAGVGSGRPLVSCPTTRFCRAFEDTELRTWNGSSWTDTRISGDRELLSLHCSADRRCIGASKRSFFSKDVHLRRIDGASWTDLTTIPGTIPRAIQPLDCWSVAGCQITFARNISRGWVDNEGFGFGYRLGDRLYDARDVSCAPNAFCGAVNGLGELGTLRDGAWTVPVSLGGGADARAISCTPSRCVVVTDRGVTVTLRIDGTTSAQRHIDTAGLTAISCAGRGFCVAVDTLGRVVRYEDGTWHTPTQHSPDGVLRSVSCVSPTFCMAAGHGYVTIYRGAGQWTSATRIGRYAAPVSCASATACVLAAKDAIVRWDGTAFGDPVQLPAFKLFTHISCTDASRCLLDTPYHHVVLDGSTPTSTFLPAGVSSCWDASGCLIAGSGDHAYTTRAHPPS